MNKKSYMSEVASVLGVKLGERFYLKSDNPTYIYFNIGKDKNRAYYFSDDGLYEDKDYECPPFFLFDILKGNLEIVKGEIKHG